MDAAEAIPDAGLQHAFMGKRIVIVQGHPDAGEGRFCHALGWSYEAGAIEGGHQVRTIDVARLDFPLIRTRREFEEGVVPDDILAALRESVEAAKKRRRKAPAKSRRTTTKRTRKRASTRR